MIAAAERARDMNYELIASLEMVQQAQQGEAAAAAASAAAQNEAAGATRDTATAAAEAAAATEKLTGNLGEEAAVATTAADAVSRLQYDIARAAAAAETALVMVRPATDEWRDSIEEAMAAAELAEFQIDAMDRAIDKSGGDAVIAATALRALAAAETEVAAAATMDADALKLEAEMAADAAKDQALLTAARLASIDATVAMARSEQILADVARGGAVATEDTTSAVKSSTIAIGRWGITWNALHWIIAGGAELLAVTIPAAIAAGAGAFVLYQGVVEQVGERMQSLYTTTEATGAMMHQTTGDVLGLGHAFQSAQNAANPIAYQLLGEYLMAARQHMTDLAGAGLQVDRALGGLGAKINVDLIQQGPQLNSLLSNMVQDLIEIGQVFGNVGHAILNFASDMPGLAEVLLRIVDAASQVVLWVSKLPPVFITTFMVFEEMSRWGGLVVTILGRLGLATSELGGSFFSAERYLGIFSNVLKAIPMLVATLISNIGSLMTGFGRIEGPVGAAGMAVRDFGADMTDAIAGLSVGWVGAIGVAAAALGILIYKTWDARGATESWIASMNKAVSSASNLQVVGVIANGLAETSTRLAAAQQDVGRTADQTGNAMGTNARFAQQYALATGYATQKVAELSAEQQQLRQQMSNVFAGAGAISKEFGGSYTEALGIADIAGVKLADTTVRFGRNLNQAGAQIEAVVLGYQRMDQTGSILANDMNAVAAAAGLQNTKVSSLNQAWDQFLGNVTGISGGIAGLFTDIGQINNAVTTAGTKFEVFGGKVVSSTDAAAHALTSFQGLGAQVWQNYNAALQQAQQYTDALRVAATTGAVSQREYTQQLAYTAQQLLPYAKYSAGAAAQLGVLVQQAGGPALHTFKQLKDWIDQNTESTRQFNKQTNDELVAMSDATKVAEAYASTLNSSVAAAMQAATISSSQLTQKTENLNSAWARAGDTISGPVVSAFRQQVESLTQVYGNTNTAIKVADAYMRQQGATAAQVANLNRQIAGTVAWLSRIHSPPPVTITVNGDITGSGAAAIAALTGAGGGGEGGAGHRVLPGGGYQTGASYASAGLHLVGEQGPELVRFGGGESVLPSWQTAPALRGGGGSGSDTINLTSHNVVNISGARIGSATRTQVLTYQRRNPSNNWALRTR